ncbi:MAG: DUF2726 domain-containing protein [Firmicutes bacterium]|nr:DUF2726 domain-containing protein [Bacillota bacterium]
MREKLIILGLSVLGMALLFLFFYLIRPRKKFPYERRDLLTSNEFPFYQILYPLCEKHGWMLLVKMRLADILAVAPGEKDYMAYFNKIKAKHTDFVLCDPDTLEVLAGVELDDPSHDRPERIERDEFVDQVYAAAGIPLLHVWMPITEKELEKELLAILPSLAGQDTEMPDEGQAEAFTASAEAHELVITKAESASLEAIPADPETKSATLQTIPATPEAEKPEDRPEIIITGLVSDLKK